MQFGLPNSYVLFNENLKGTKLAGGLIAEN